jgi:hypothetical protein
MYVCMYVCMHVCNVCMYVEKYNPPTLRHSGPRLSKKAALSWDDECGQYVIPFMGADASVVRSSFRALSMAAVGSVGSVGSGVWVHVHVHDIQYIRFISFYVCVYVCTYVCMYVCLYVCLYVCIYI